ncbi:MAG: HAD-IIIC family phosphatase [Bryobacteraceae bacterium]
MQENVNQVTALKEEIRATMAAGRVLSVHALLCELWAKSRTSASASLIVSCLQQGKAQLPLRPFRVAILRSFTVEAAVPFLLADALVAGIGLDIYVSPFNAYAQEILDPSSPLYAFSPDLVILATQTRDLAPKLWSEAADAETGQLTAAAAEVAETLRGLARKFRSHSPAPLVLHNCELPEAPAAGVLDCQSASGQLAAIRHVNQRLLDLATEAPATYVLDYDALVARRGRSNWYDERRWLSARLPVRSEYVGDLASEWMRYIRPLTGCIGKVLVTDLDNTLWGGVAGEDGYDRIRVGTEYPGAAYRALQRAMLDLRRRGILLAISSKNNPGDVMPVLTGHPGMLLRPEHFAAMRVNWNDKPASLREIAAELNVGTDSLVFLDDNPLERRRVRLEMPEVTVIELPEDPFGYAAALRSCTAFERLSLSEEDVRREQYYSRQRIREEAKREAASIEEFYRSLGQEIEVALMTSTTLPRVAQLTQKTNQFNLTTRRYSEAEIERIAETEGCRVYTVHVRDRFGDNGLVGVSITKTRGTVTEIDSLLLSCRVIGRTVETALLAFLLDRCRTEGIEHLQGWFFPTRKNLPAAGFYEQNGFRRIEENERGSLWGIAIAEASVQFPPWIRLKTDLLEGTLTRYVNA